MKSSFLVSFVLLAGCVAAPVSAPPPRTIAARHPAAASALVVLAPASASLVSGRLTFVPMSGGVHLTGEIGGLAAGSTHGLHVHEKGDCSAADASSAGPHFDTAARAHGRPGGALHHAGDLPNVVAGSDGVARVDAHIDGLALGGSAGADILDRALVVHAQADDYASQPAGNSGARVACGVIRAGR